VRQKQSLQKIHHIVAALTAIAVGFSTLTIDTDALAQRKKSSSAWHKKRGDGYFAKRRFSDALASYTVAQAISPRPAYAVAMGRALEAMGHTKASLTLYRYVLTVIDAPGLLNNLRSRVLLLEQGPRATAPVPRPQPTVVTRPVPRPTIVRRPTPPPPPPPRRTSNLGKLRLMVMPPGASIHIDSQRVGASPISSAISLIEGKHTISVSLAGYIPLSRPVWIRRGKIAALSLTLVPSASKATPPPATSSGTLTIYGVPLGATVYVSGRVAPVKDGRVRIRVYPGNHTVEVRHSSFATYKTRHRITAGQNVTVTVRMQRR
jgi:hypothetical protein